MKYYLTVFTNCTCDHLTQDATHTMQCFYYTCSVSPCTHVYLIMAAKDTTQFCPVYKGVRAQHWLQGATLKGQVQGWG